MKKADHHRLVWVGGLAAGAAVLGAGVWWYESSKAQTAASTPNSTASNQPSAPTGSTTQTTTTTTTPTTSTSSNGGVTDNGPQLPGSP